MTIDERLERLTERHEAMAESMEMLVVMVREQSQQMADLLLVTREHTTHLATDSEHIRALARIAEIHEARLTRLEDGKRKP
jgi:chemotaxis protein CheY-P-specific phosphatase CheC